MAGGIQRVADRRRRERGAISAMAGIVMLFITVPVLALAVDVGRLAWNRRQLQEVADIAALDAMRAFGQCRENSGDPVAAAQASAVRNGYDGNLAEAPNQVQIGSVSTGADGVRMFTAGGVAATATAVRVFATRSVPFTMIAAAILPGQATLQAEAVAAREAIGSLEAGSFAARVDTSNSPLLNELFGGLLGGPLAVSAVSYEGLANATFTVGDLMVAAGVASLEDLLALELTGPEYLSLLADALSDGGDASAAATLAAIAGAVDAGTTVALGEILDVAAGVNDAALDAQLNAFDMLDVGAQFASGGNGIVLDNALDLPGVSTSTRLRVVQAPRIAVGPPGRDASGDWNTEVRTGQVRLAITVGVGNIPLLGFSRPVALDLFLEAAQTRAHLEAIDCADASDPVHRVLVGAEPGLVRLGIGKYPDFETSPDPIPSDLVTLSLRVPPLIGPIIDIAKITGYADIPFQSAGIDIRFDGPFVPQIEEPSEDNTQTVGTPLGDGLSNALATLLANAEIEVELLGITTLTIAQQNAAITAVTNALQPALTVLDAPLLDLLNALGLTLGGADVTILWLGANHPDDPATGDPLGVPELAR